MEHEEGSSMDVNEVVQKIETRAQSRPAFKFGVLVLAVGIGSYWGAGRKATRISKDVRLIRKNVAAIGEFMAAQSAVDEVQAYQGVFDQLFGPNRLRKAS